MSGQRLCATSLLIVGLLGCARPATPPVVEPPPPLGVAQTDERPRRDALLATVGDVEIPMAEFDEIFALKAKKYLDRGREMPASARERYERSIAGRLIEFSLLEQEARRVGVDYDPADVERRLADAKQRIEDWSRHLQIRGETEASLRAMYITELREERLLAHRGAAVSADDVVAEFDRRKADFTSQAPWVELTVVEVRPPDLATGIPSTSIPECDRYLAAFSRCIDARFPEAAKEQTRAAVAQSAQAWSTVAAAGGPGLDALARTCTTATETAREATRDLGCDFDEAPTGNAPQAAADRVHRELTARGADFMAVAEALRARGEIVLEPTRAPTSLDRLEPAVAEAIRRLQVGRVSKPVQAGVRTVIVRLERKWPAGELPLEAVRASLTEELGERKRDEARKALWDELWQRYPVHAHAPAAVAAMEAR